MFDYPVASKLANEALDHWISSRLNEAAGLYAKALELSDPEHHAHATFHRQFAGVLDALGRGSEALAHYETAVASARRMYGDDIHIEVRTWRYFLGAHLVRHHAPSLALEAIAPSLAGFTGEWLLRFVEAQALFALGRSAEALASAKLSLANAPSPEKRGELAKLLTDLGLPIDAALFS
jgi:tetratricopeptide (TPR) repeat protein